MTKRFLVIHVWPEAIAPTIMPTPYESYLEAENAARDFSKVEKVRPGHKYYAAFLPAEVAA